MRSTQIVTTEPETTNVDVRGALFNIYYIYNSICSDESASKRARFTSMTCRQTSPRSKDDRFRNMMVVCNSIANLSSTQETHGDAYYIRGSARYIVQGQKCDLVEVVDINQI